MTTDELIQYFEDEWNDANGYGLDVGTLSRHPDLIGQQFGEYARKKSLESAEKMFTNLPAAEAERARRQYSDMKGNAVEKAFIHRDIKPLMDRYADVAKALTKADNVGTWEEAIREFEGLGKSKIKEELFKEKTLGIRDLITKSEKIKDRESLEEFQTFLTNKQPILKDIDVMAVFKKRLSSRKGFIEKIERRKETFFKDVAENPASLRRILSGKQSVKSVATSQGVTIAEAEKGLDDLFIAHKGGKIIRDGGLVDSRTGKKFQLY